MPTFIGHENSDFDKGKYMEQFDPVVSSLNREIEQMRKAGEALYDGFTDMMTQEQIDRFERLYAKELDLFLSA